MLVSITTLKKHIRSPMPCRQIVDIWSLHLLYLSIPSVFLNDIYPKWAKLKVTIGEQKEIVNGITQVDILHRIPLFPTGHQTMSVTYAAKNALHQTLTVEKIQPPAVDPLASPTPIGVAITKESTATVQPQVDQAGAQLPVYRPRCI